MLPGRTATCLPHGEKVGVATTEAATQGGSAGGSHKRGGARHFRSCPEPGGCTARRMAASLRVVMGNRALARLQAATTLAL